MSIKNEVKHPDLLEESVLRTATLSVLAHFDDIHREGLQDTPRRVEESLKSLLSGYSRETELRDALTTFDSEGYSGLIISKDIEFYSICEHHLLQFWGRAHVGYIPSGRILGISKLARVVDIFARRFQNQERLTKQVANAIVTTVKPLGVAVVMEGIHMCMRSRGVSQQNSTMITSEMLGEFRSDTALRQEFMSMLQLRDRTL